MDFWLLSQSYLGLAELTQDICLAFGQKIVKDDDQRIERLLFYFDGLQQQIGPIVRHQSTPKTSFVSIRLSEYKFDAD